MAEQVVTEIIVDARGAKEGITQYTQALNSAGDATDAFGNKISGGFSRAEKAADQYLAKLDPTFNASQRLGKETQTIGTAIDGLERQLMRGAVTIEQYNQRMSLLAGRMGQIKTATAELAAGSITADTAMQRLSMQTQRHAAAMSPATDQSKRLGFAMRDLAIQSQDFFVQLASGGRPLQAFIQQASQVAQVNQNMGVSFREMASAVGDKLVAGLRLLISPLGLAITGFTALAGVFALAVSRAVELDGLNRKLGVAIAATGNTANVSTTQLQAYIASLREAGVAADVAAKAAEALARNTQLTPAQRGTVQRLTPDVNAALGGGDKELVATQKLVAEAVAGSATAIAELDKQLNFLNPNLAATVAASKDATGRLTESGLAVDALSQRVQGLNQQSLSPMVDVFTKLGTEWRNFITALAQSSFVQGVIDSLAVGFQNLARAMGLVTQQGLAKDLRDLELQRERILSGKDSNSRLQDIGAGSMVLEKAPLEEVEGKLADIRKKIADIGDAEKKTISLGPTGGGGAGAVGGGGLSPAAIRSKELDELAKKTVDASKGGRIAELTKQYKDLEVELRTIGQRTPENAARFDNLTKAIDLDKKAIAELSKGTKEHKTEGERLAERLDKNLQKTNEAAASQMQLAEAHKAGGEQVLHLTAEMKAEAEVIGSGLLPSMAGYLEAVEKQTAANENLARSTGAAKIEEQINGLNQQVEAQLRVNAAFDGSEQSLTHAKNAEQAYAAVLKSEIQPGTEKFTDTVFRMTDALDRGAEATKALSDQQSALSELSSMFSRAFNTISDAIVNSMFQAGGAVVDFGRIAKAIAQQVLAAFLQLAVLNPLLNSLFNQNNMTLGAAFGALGGVGGGGGGAGGGLMGLLQLGSTANSMSGGGVSNMLGLGRIFDTSTLGTFGSAGAVANLMQTPIYGGTGAIFGGAASNLAATTATNAAIAAELGGAAGPATAGAFTGAGGTAPFTVGAGLGVLGGAAAGFGVGSLAGGFVQSSMNKVGPAPMIGAGTGALAGAIIGSVIPVIGTLIGGLVGGIIGGVGGGFVGPRPKSPFSSIGLSIGPGGQLVQGPTIAQGTDTQALTTNTTANVGWLNAVMAAQGLGLSGLGTVGAIGANTPGGFQAPQKVADFQAAFSQMRFGMAGPGGAVLQGRSFEGVQQLSDVAVAVKQFVATLETSNAADRIGDFLATLGGVASADIPAKLAGITTFITETVPTLLGERNVGSLNAAVAQINQTFAPAIQMAQELSYKEAELTAARDAAIKMAIDQVTIQEQINNQSLVLRGAQARATLSGDPAELQAAQLTAFDLSAQQQRMQMTQHLKETYGDTVTQTEGFAGTMALLEQTLADERLAVIKQFSADAIGVERMTAKQIEDAQHQLRVANANFAVRFRQAQGVVDPSMARGAAEFALGVQQEAERRDFANGLIETWGESFRATKDFADEMAILEQVLAQERLAIQSEYNRQAEAEAKAAAAEAKAAADALAQASRGFINQALGLSVRELNARASMDPRLGQAAQLYAFDVAANRERQEFLQSTIDAFGQAYTTTASYAVEAARLEDVLAKERLAIQRQFNDNATASATAAVTSLADYAASLTRSDLSPLSPQKQYDLALGQFQAVSGAAVAGDLASIQKFQQFSDAFLQASRGVYGSGAAYNADFERVTAALRQIGTIPADTLTASAYTAEMRTQTEQLIGASTTLADLLRSIRTVMEQNNSAPARAAA